MRKLLRKIILWALNAEPVVHDAAGMDREIRKTRGNG